MDERPSCTRWRSWALCLTVLGASACSTLLQGVARTAADEAIGGSDSPRSATADPAARAPDGSRANAPGTRDAAGAASTPSRPESTAGTASTYESAPMVGLSTSTFARPYSLVGSLFQRPGTTPGCQIGARLLRMEFVYAPEVTPVDASGPLELRVARPGVPLHQLFTLDPDLRSARAFHSGAKLSGDGPVCARSFAHYYLGLALGWGVTTPFAVSR